MTRRFHFRPGTILSSLAAALLLTSNSPSQTTGTDPSPASPAMVELAYAPEDGSMFEITETFERVTDMPGQDPITDLRTRVSRMLVTCTDEGYTNSVTVVSQSLTRNGSEVASPVNAALRNLVLTYNLSKDGTMTGIAGYGQLPEAMKGRFAAQVAATMARMLNVDALQRRDEEAYGSLYEGLIGSTVTVGEISVSAAAQPLPLGGSAAVYSVSTSEMETDGPLVLRQLFSTDPESLANEFETVAVPALQEAATQGMVTTMLPEDHVSAAVSGRASTVIDPAGLLVGSREVSMTFELGMGNPDDTASPNMVRITETSRFEAAKVETEMMVEQTPQQ
ncbi:MAG: hypothetical protein OXN97_11370 [Bryobacterales bacterium]|nr:hypothetical protein [Bryobacterales bacterium]